ncbi:aspartate 1-decarboxylase [Microbacterium sp. MPKO10]|uniref:aspartate 1-decarboxylase n=1 Tax=Microbacterium sp. MPKO10 TaxID=2989818 RepID=UPI0022359B55|nr:aspartate 1-decarboxylase [Microbacterium sp. MPKO10]MCW4458900.1 aspartate 1-decarboxylase [Microbacterium sp. MPKO10]
MLRTVLTSKIHRATVTAADLDYVGSITIDSELMDASGLADGEKVAVLDITNGARLETYVITGRPGGGDIEINGAAAHLVHPGDLVIIVAYGLVNEEELQTHRPRIVHVDALNRITGIGSDASEPAPGSVRSEAAAHA